MGVVGVCPTCCHDLRIEEELTIAPPRGPCYVCGKELAVVRREPGVPWVIGSALWSSAVDRYASARVENIKKRSEAPPPPSDPPMPVGQKEPGWDA